jgi:hypothetical protein
VTNRLTDNALHWVIVLGILLFVGGDVVAHGGVSMEDDACVMQVGPYKAHFTGYQPLLRASQEFCEDIPVAADAIIVLDFIDRPLREMSVDFRVVSDVNRIGVNATYDDLGSDRDIEAATVFYERPAVYPRGSLNIELEFDVAGRFIGVVTARDVKTDRLYRSVFPFSVGVKSWSGATTWLVLVLIVGALLYIVPFKFKARETAA